MIKEKRSNLYFVGSAIVLGLSIYLYSDFFCRSLESCYKQEVAFFEPAFFAIIGYLVNALFLLFFPAKVFTSWLKHIAWWFFILTAVAVGSTSQGGFLPLYNKVQVVLFWMAVLFVITLVYALIMRKKLKGNS